MCSCFTTSAGKSSLILFVTLISLLSTPQTDSLVFAGTLFLLFLSHLGLFGTKKPLPHEFLINISWSSVLIFARACCQVAAFKGAGSKENISQTNSAKKSRSSFANTDQRSAQRATSRCAAQTTGSHRCVFLRLFVFPAIKQILYKTASVICLKMTPPTSAR